MTAKAPPAHPESCLSGLRLKRRFVSTTRVSPCLERFLPDSTIPAPAPGALAPRSARFITPPAPVPCSSRGRTHPSYFSSTS